MTDTSSITLPDVVTSAPAPTTAAYTPTAQFLRKWAVYVWSSETGAGTVLSQSETGFDLRMTCVTQQSDVETPNIAIVTVYNASDDTMRTVTQEFDKIMVQAGYQNGAFGVIFEGTLKQLEHGHESPTETYLKLYAADWDWGYMTATMNHVHPAGWSYEQVYKQGIESFKQYQIKEGYTDIAPLPSGAQNWRSKVAMGMAVDEMNDATISTNQVWSIQDGNMIRMNADRSTNLPAPPLVINAQSGMIGFPRVTNQGIMVTILADPQVKIGGLIEINNADISGAGGPLGSTLVQNFPSYRSPPNFFAPTTEDGIYRVLVKEYELDTRGQPWYCHIICLAVDSTTSQRVLGGAPR